MTRTDWIICRADAREKPLLVFERRADALAHYRKIGCPSALMVGRRETTVRTVKEHVRVNAPVDFTVPESLGVAA